MSVNLVPKRRRSVGPRAITRRRSRKTFALLTATILFAALGSVKGREVRADSQTQMRQQPASSGSLVVQGRITGIQGVLATLKMPDGYPGRAGGHAQFVIAGPIFKVDVSRARLLLPDGKQADKLPLAVGDCVLMVLSGPDSESPAPGSPGNVNQTYFASIYRTYRAERHDHYPLMRRFEAMSTDKRRKGPTGQGLFEKLPFLIL